MGLHLGSRQAGLSDLRAVPRSTVECAGSRPVTRAGADVNEGAPDTTGQ